MSFEYAKAFESLNMLYVKVLNKILNRIHLTGFWICHGFQICCDSGCTRVLNMSGFIEKTLHHIDAWKGSDYSSSSGSKYARVTEGSKKMMHHRCLTGFQIFLRFWTGHGSEHARRSIIDIWYGSKYASSS